MQSNNTMDCWLKGGIPRRFQTIDENVAQDCSELQQSLDSLHAPFSINNDQDHAVMSGFRSPTYTPNSTPVSAEPYNPDSPPSMMPLPPLLSLERSTRWTQLDEITAKIANLEKCAKSNARLLTHISACVQANNHCIRDMFKCLKDHIKD